MEYYSAAVGAVALYGYVKTAVKGYQVVTTTAAAAKYTYSWYKWTKGQDSFEKDLIILEESDDKEYTIVDKG